jgi:K+/H+ antiporter YhaU regulatory subunit KhtT
LEIGKTGASVLAIVRDGVPTPNPRADVTLAVGDHLLVLGTSDQLSAVEQAIGRKR